MKVIKQGDYAVLRKKVYPSIHAEIQSFRLQHEKIHIHANPADLSTPELPTIYDFFWT